MSRYKQKDHPLGGLSVCWWRLRELNKCYKILVYMNYLHFSLPSCPHKCPQVMKPLGDDQDLQWLLSSLIQKPGG